MKGFTGHFVKKNLTVILASGLRVILQKVEIVP